MYDWSKADNIIFGFDDRRLVLAGRADGALPAD